MVWKICRSFLLFSFRKWNSNTLRTIRISRPQTHIHNQQLNEKCDRLIHLFFIILFLWYKSLNEWATLNHFWRVKCCNDGIHTWNGDDGFSFYFFIFLTVFPRPFHFIHCQKRRRVHTNQWLSDGKAKIYIR